MSAQIAVAIVSYETRDLLDACLRSLQPDVEAGLAEAWVVDNGSTDGSPDMVRERHPWATLVEPSENLGFGRAVNLVADRTDTPWVAPANADIAFEPGALAALLEAGREHPGAGAVAPRLILPDGSTQHSVYRFPTVPFTAAFNLHLHRLVPHGGDRMLLEGLWDPERAREVDWAVGAFLVVRREAWEAVGGFDEQQWMYAEDLDLGWRLAQAGWPTRYEPRARVHHEQSAATSAAWGESRTARWMDATYVWMARRRGLPRTWTCAAINVAGATAGSVLRRRPQDRRWAKLHARSGLRRFPTIRSGR